MMLITLLSAVSLEDRSISTATAQTISCRISGLSEDTPVTWIDPDDIEILETDTENYLVDQGNFVFGSKSATLTIKTAKMGSLTSGDRYKCKLKSPKYPTNSPDIIKQMVLTLLNLGRL